MYALISENAAFNIVLFIRERAELAKVLLNSRVFDKTHIIVWYLIGHCPKSII